jgi:hypothetical protein
MVLVVIVLGYVLIGCASYDSFNRSLRAGFKITITLLQSVLMSVLIFLMWHHSQRTVSSSGDVLDTLNNYAVVNGCSDSYTKVNVETQAKTIS